ncbi:hypothetical protein B0G84_3273 [Paraburkholderia sp. BL8N3]|nr:hypothetical protein [Paraburkholderia sp. BL8N3]TCK37973.1 hypothetical protein B0G84_3273 [Paraburkholderia sp. BL8N3]
MNDMRMPPPPGPKAKPLAPAFDLERRHEVIATKAFGAVTINDVGADAFERIAVASKGETEAMMRSLLCAAAVGPNGERFTLDLLANFPARAFADRITLMRAAARVNGIAGDDVEKA